MAIFFRSNRGECVRQSRAENCAYCSAGFGSRGTVAPTSKSPGGGEKTYQPRIARRNWAGAHGIAFPAGIACLRNPKRRIRNQNSRVHRFVRSEHWSSTALLRQTITPCYLIILTV